jgi:AbrB family looped-hinge helix DNA binding protein
MLADSQNKTLYASTAFPAFVALDMGYIQPSAESTPSSVPPYVAPHLWLRLNRNTTNRIPGVPMATITVTRRGQTTIPIELRKKYDIQEGATLEVEDTGSGILLKKAKSTLDLVGTGRRSQKEVFTFLDKMREEDER